MQADYWHQCWHDNAIAFNQAAPNPYLQHYFPLLRTQIDDKIFVPLCGKSVDMVWLAAQQRRVLGVELSAIALEDFFASLQQPFSIIPEPAHRLYHTASYDLYQGDLFTLPASTFAQINAVYDRAALIALPPGALRDQYIDFLATHIPTQCPMLLLTYVFDQDKKPGPPFVIDETRLRALMGTRFSIEKLATKPVKAHAEWQAKGIATLHEEAYLLHRL